MPEVIQIGFAWALVIVTLGISVSIVTSARAKARAAAKDADPDVRELVELKETVQRLSEEVADLNERVDFAERLLARQRDAEQIKGGS